MDYKIYRTFHLMGELEKTRLHQILFAAGCYNILWGLWVIIFPEQLFQLMGAPPINYLPIWQSIGLIIGVYGIGYLIAATTIERYWPIVLVGFLGKLGGPLGIAYYVYFDHIPWPFLLVTLFNDLIWLLPFARMLQLAYRAADGYVVDVKTAVKGTASAIYAKFDEQLFRQLAPKSIRLIRFDGSSTGDLIQLKFPFISTIATFEVVDHAVTENHAYFIDEGNVLPSLVEYWQHRHVMTQKGEHTVIHDCITFKGSTMVTGALLYPFIWLDMYLRKPKYRRVFHSRNQH